MTLPIDRTQLALVGTNQNPGNKFASSPNKSALTIAYDTIDELNQKVNDHASNPVLPHADGSVTNAKLANGAVGTSKIADSSVTPAKIPNASLDASKFVADALTNETQNGLRITALEILKKYFRYQGTNENNINVICGSVLNAVASDLVGCVVAGGGTQPGTENVIGGNIAGVGDNTISNLPTELGTNANMAVITGGYDNVNNGLGSFLSGHHNYITKLATHFAMSGGTYNKADKGSYSVIAGGYGNQITGDADPEIIDATDGVISGGRLNVLDASVGGVIGGGSSSTATTSNYATIDGGFGNSITASNQSSIGGGASNVIATSASAMVAGGVSNSVTNSQGGAIGGGTNNVITNSSTNSRIGGGNANSINNGAHALIGGGQRNTIANGNYGVVVGGYENQANANYTTAMGNSSVAKRVGEIAYANGKNVTAGDCQNTINLIKRTTTDGVVKSNILAVASNNMANYKVDVLAVRTDVVGECMSWNISGLLKNVGGTGSIVGSTVLSTQNSTGTLSWAVAVAYEGGGISVKTTGEAAKTINWVIKVEMLELIV